MSQLKRYNGTSWETVGGVVTGDTLPIGSEVNYNGSSVPAGWEEIDDTSECTTTERAVGKWTDGRTIYEKSGTINITDRNITIFTITNLDFVIYCQCCLKRTGNYHNINSFGKDANDYGLVYMYGNNVIYDSSYTGTLYATIRYVKSS